jgi:hypothetical protein
MVYLNNAVIQEYNAGQVSQIVCGGQSLPSTGEGTSLLVWERYLYSTL